MVLLTGRRFGSVDRSGYGSDQLLGASAMAERTMEETFLGFLAGADAATEVVQCVKCKGVFVIKLEDTDKLQCCPFCERLWVARNTGTNPYK